MALNNFFLRQHSPDVAFCGYTIPHPSENKLHLRIETREMSAVDALREGLEQLQSLSDHVLETFEVIMFQYMVHSFINHNFNIVRRLWQITNQNKWKHKVI